MEELQIIVDHTHKFILSERMYRFRYAIFDTIRNLPCPLTCDLAMMNAVSSSASTVVHNLKLARLAMLDDDLVYESAVVSRSYCVFIGVR